MSEVRHNAQEQRYELDTEAGPAIAAYRDGNGIVVFTHTAVPSAAEGHGVGTRLIAGALADVRARGLKLVAECPFVAAYLERHPGDGDLIAG